MDIAYLNRLVELLEAHGFHVGNMLGAGASGAVFPASRRSKTGVVKLTFSPSDARLAQYLTRHMRPSALPEVWDVYVLPQLDFDESEYYAIFREDIDDVHRRLTEPARDALREVEDLITDGLEPNLAKRAMSTLTKLPRHIAPELWSQIARWRTQALELLLWTRNTGIHVHDRRGDNIGIRPATGEFVIRDFGSNYGTSELEPVTRSLDGVRSHLWEKS